MATLIKPSVREAAEDLVRANLEAAPEITKAYPFPAADEIRLIYVDPTTMPLRAGDTHRPRSISARGKTQIHSAALRISTLLRLSVIRPKEAEGVAHLLDKWGQWNDAVVLWEKPQ